MTDAPQDPDERSRVYEERALAYEQLLSDTSALTEGMYDAGPLGPASYPTTQTTSAQNLTSPPVPSPLSVRQRPKKRKPGQRPRLTPEERAWVKHAWLTAPRTDLGRVRKGYGLTALAERFRVSEKEVLRAIRD